MVRLARAFPQILNQVLFEELIQQRILMLYKKMTMTRPFLFAWESFESWVCFILSVTVYKKKILIYIVAAYAISWITSAKRKH